MVITVCCLMHTSRLFSEVFFSCKFSTMTRHYLYVAGERGCYIRKRSPATALHSPQDEILNSLTDPSFFKSQTPYPLPTFGQNESCMALVPQKESKCFLKQKEGDSFA